MKTSSQSNIEMINTETLKTDFERDGFVVIRDYFSADEIDEFRLRAIPLAKHLLGTEGNIEGVKHNKYQNLLKSINRHDEWFNQQLAHGRHMTTISDLLGGEIYGASAAWFDRPDGQSIGVDPHVDAIPDKKWRDGATIWIALDPVQKSNGCVYYLRGSHKNKYPAVIPIPDIDTESDAAFAVELKPGDVAIHHARTVHWSGGNESGRPRRAISFFYFGVRADSDS